MRALNVFAGVVILFITALCFGQTHTDENRTYMSEMFDGVWFIDSSKEVIRIRVERSGISILIDEATYLRGAEVIDLDKKEKSISFSFENKVFTFTRSSSSFIRFSTPDGVMMAERSRRLTKQDNEVLDIWLNTKPNPCGLYNQHC